MRTRQELPPAPPAARPAARRSRSPAAAQAGLSAGEREIRVVVTWLLSQAFEQTGVRVAEDKIAYQRIVEAAEKALAELKDKPAAVISLPYLTADASGPKHLDARLTREMIDELVKY
jgi:molecular chaperone DnaK (HSP70)